jgi:hypothetical protein
MQDRPCRGFLQSEPHLSAGIAEAQTLVLIRCPSFIWSRLPSAFLFPPTRFYAPPRCGKGCRIPFDLLGVLVVA